jgi:phosphoribosylaminoimidazole synthetase
VNEYRDSGVNLDKLREYHEGIRSLISSTYRRTVVGAGHYAGVVNINGINLAIHTDGVGTKTLLALRTRKFKPIGIDCVAMNVNDLVCVGARPVALVDYLALESEDDELVKEIIEGIVEGAKVSDSEVVGGETAIMKGVVNGFDVACTALGVVEKTKLGNEVRPGDVLLGLASDGIHANGYSLVRKLIDEGKLSLEDWEDELMRPTRIYVREVLSVLDLIKGAAHITGGAFAKLRRITEYSLEINLPDPPDVFKEIERAGVSHREMHRVFNMGIGMILFVPEDTVEEVENKLSNRVKTYRLGKVRGDQGKIKLRSYKNQILDI